MRKDTKERVVSSKVARRDKERLSAGSLDAPLGVLLCVCTCVCVGGGTS